MNKKLMAVAVAGALAAPGLALAQTSTVQIGGGLNMLYYSHQPHNPNVSQRTDILESSESELFFHGEESLGRGISAWFRCTSTIDGFIGGAGGTSGWCGRNSGLGFKGSFGNVFGGNWDAPQKLVHNRARGWWGATNSLTGGTVIILNNGNASGQVNPITTSTATLSSTGVTQITRATSGNPASFNRRQAQSWNYHSPVWGGFSAQAAFSAANEGTGNPDTSATINQRLWSLAGNYDNGPLYLGLAYERHKDYNPGNVASGPLALNYAGGDDHNWTFVAGYTFAGVFSIRGLYARNEYEVTNTTGIKNRGWAAYADWAIQGPHTLRAQYASLGDTKGNSATNANSYKGPAGTGCGPLSASSCAGSTGAKVWAFAYSYAFSKRTEASLVYNRMRNDSNASFSMGKVASTAGNTQTSTGLLVKHKF